MANTPKKNKIDLGLILKLLSSPQISLDQVGVKMFIDRFARGEENEEVGNDLILNIIKAGTGGLRYGVQADKGNKRFAQQMTKAIFSGAVERHKQEMKVQDKKERKEMAKLRYYLPENVEKRFNRQRELQEAIIAETDDLKKNKIREIAKEVEELDIIEEKALDVGLSGKEEILDYSKDNFTTAEQQRVLNAPKMEEKAEDIMNRKYARLFGKVSKRIKELKSDVANIDIDIVDAEKSIEDDLVMKKRESAYVLGGVELEQLVNDEQFKLLIPQEKIKIFNALSTFYDNALKTKGKRRKYVRENIRRNVSAGDTKDDFELSKEEVRDIILQDTGIDIFGAPQERKNIDDEQREHFLRIFNVDLRKDVLRPDTPFEEMMLFLRRNYGDVDQGLLNGTWGEERERVKQLLRDKYKFKSKELDSPENYIYLAKDLKELGFDNLIPERLIQQRKKDNIFGKTINQDIAMERQEIEKLLRKREQYTKTRKETKEILNDASISRTEKLARLAEKPEVKPLIKQRWNKRLQLLEKIKELESEDLTKVNREKIANIEFNRLKAREKSTSIDAIGNLNRIKAERLAKKNTQKRQDFAVKLASLGLQSKKAPSSKQAIQSMGLRTLKRRAKKKKNNK